MTRLITLPRLFLCVFAVCSTLGCAANVGDAPITDAPYDDQLAIPTAQAIEEWSPPDRYGAYVLTADASASHEVTSWSRYNSEGGEVFVERNGVGRYTVHAQSIRNASGNVQVVAYGSDATRCKVSSWTTSSSRYPNSLAVGVRCHDVTGALADSRFAMHFLGKDRYGEILNAGFAWANVANASHTAPSAYSDVDGGASVEITRNGQGRYTVYFRTVEDWGLAGFAHVTAYGATPEYCTINNVALLPHEPGVYVAVNCFDTNGSYADSRFSVLWHTFGFYDHPAFSTLYADRATTSEYFPSQQSGWNETRMTAKRSSTGSYSYETLVLGARLPLVTARDYTGNYCKLYSRVLDRVSIRCYDENGERADTRYYSTAFDAQE